MGLNGDDVEANLERRELGMRREPTFRSTAQAALLLGSDHFSRLSEAVAALLLHLTEDEPRTAPGDHVQLVAGRPGVRPEDPVAAQPVVPDSPALGR
jgi:hypothetical protein